MIGNRDKLKEFYIPNYVLVGGDMPKIKFTPSCPVIVFVNAKSGGQLGGELLLTYRALLNENQVFDLGEMAPDKVLHKLYVTLETFKFAGDSLAADIEKRLRIIVAGGDGTAGWILSVVSDLKLPKPPPIAMVPLGTGNNLHFAFGWGKKNPGTDRQSVQYFLNQVKAAKEMQIDSWHIVMRMKNPNIRDPTTPLELPHSLHAFQQEGFQTFRGGFWNYFSVGMDAQISYDFHAQRKLHAEKFKNQLVNQSTYFKLGCTQGWFCAPIMHPSSRNVAHLTKITFMKRQGHWEELQVPPSIRSIVCLNLPSFSGGLDPWGKPNRNKVENRDLTPPYVDDGLLEIVGFRDAWHGLALLVPKGHGTRLAQARGIRFEFCCKGAVNHTFMRIDGEPWRQPLPADNNSVYIEISHFGQVSMLATPLKRSKSVSEPESPVSSHDEDDISSNEEEYLEDSAERRKFGASDTFKFPDGVQIVRRN